MFVKLRPNLYEDGQRILDNAARTARRCTTWPAWKRQGGSVTQQQKHAVKYVSSGGHSDAFECLCGWKSNGYWDLEEAAWEEWLLHAHDTDTPVEEKDRARQARVVGDRDQRLASLQRQRAWIDQQIEKLKPSGG